MSYAPSAALKHRHDAIRGACSRAGVDALIVTTRSNIHLTVVEGTYDTTLAKLLTSLGVARVAFEASHITVSRYNWLTSTLAHESSAPALVPLENVVERLRLRKDEYELAMLRESARLL